MEQRKLNLVRFLSFFFIIALCISLLSSCVTVNNTKTEATETTIVEDADAKAVVEANEENEEEDEDEDEDQ